MYNITRLYADRTNRRGSALPPTPPLDEYYLLYNRAALSYVIQSTKIVYTRGEIN